MFATVYKEHILFRGELSDNDEDIDFGELDTRVFELTSEVDHLQPNRYPQLRLDYLGVTGEIEIIFSYRKTWEDRDSDLLDYQDEVQEVIENGIGCIISERENLGITSE